MSDEPPIAAVVLAAGGSTRLGRPKQLVPIDGEPLVRRAARAALDAGCRPVMVVIGAAADAVGAAVADLPVLRVTNPRWADGVGTSIACGVSAAAAHRPAGCIVLPCDQPRLTAGVLATLIERFRDGGFSAVACTYGGTTGSPVLFAPELFDRLAALTGDSGAKRVLRGCSTLQVVDFPGGDLDIDTDADLRRLKLRRGPFNCPEGNSRSVRTRQAAALPARATPTRPAPPTAPSSRAPGAGPSASRA